jgi:hypothetical protein
MPCVKVQTQKLPMALDAMSVIGFLAGGGIPPSTAGSPADDAYRNLNIGW